jgi:hypothetical protein
MHLLILTVIFVWVVLPLFRRAQKAFGSWLGDVLDNHNRRYYARIAREATRRDDIRFGPEVGPGWKPPVRSAPLTKAQCEAMLDAAIDRRKSPGYLAKLASYYEAFTPSPTFEYLDKKRLGKL